MKNEKKKTRWAVLLDSFDRLSKGNEVRIREVLPHSWHGGSNLETEDVRIKVFAVKEVAPNMLLVHADKADYYMYNYRLSEHNLCFPSKWNWRACKPVKMGEQICFTRKIQQNGFREESFMTNPVFKIDVIYQGLLIAWCKDREKGNDIGYVIDEIVVYSTGATCGQHYWVWNMPIQSLNEKTTASITVDLGGEYISKSVEFTPRSAKSIGNDWTLLEGDDGNFYIWTTSMDYGWCED